MNRPSDKTISNEPAGGDPAESRQRTNRKLVLDLATVEYGLRQAVDNQQSEPEVVLLAAHERMLVAELRDRDVSVHPIKTPR